MDYMIMIWWCLAGVCLALGFLGCFINKVPGPIAVVVAVLIGKFCIHIPFDNQVIGIVIALAVASMIASKVLVKMVKKLHEFSKRGSWGTTLGSIAGLCLLSATASSESTPLMILAFVVGMIILPFILSFLLELSNKQGTSIAAKCAVSATASYLADSMLKLAVFCYAVYAMFMM